MTLIAINTDQRSYKKSLEKYRRVITETFQVIASRAASFNVVLAASGLPTVGVSVHPADTGCLCTELYIASQDDQKFLIQATYDSKYADPAKQDPDPLSRAVVRTSSGQRIKKAVEVDQLGNPVVLSNRAPPDKPLEIESSLEVFKVTKNYSSDDILGILVLKDTLNNATFNGFPAYSLRMEDISTSQKTENGTTFWEYVFSIVYNRDLWNPVYLLNAGYYYIDNSGNKVVNVGSDNKPLAKPLLLNSTGGLAGGAGSGPPSYSAFYPYPSTSWATVPWA